MAILIRPARRDDHARIGLWYPELGSGDEIAPLEAWAEKELDNTTVAELGGEPVGFCHAHVLDGEGYVRQLVSDPAVRRQGVGRALLEAFLDSLRAQRFERWRLNVKPENVQAVTLYRSLGLEVVHESVALDFPWEWLEQRGEREPTARVREPEPHEYERLEAALGVPPGLIAGKSMAADTFVRVIEDDGPRGLGVFDTSFPGCFPFRAESFTYAVQLLRALQPLASQPQMRIVLEGAPELDASFLAAGATAHLRFVHMAGPVGGRTES